MPGCGTRRKHTFSANSRNEVMPSILAVLNRGAALRTLCRNQERAGPKRYTCASAEAQAAAPAASVFAAWPFGAKAALVPVSGQDPDQLLQVTAAPAAADQYKR